MILYRHRRLVFVLVLVMLPWLVGRAAAPSPDAPVQDFRLLVEPLSAEWEARLVPPLLQNLLRIAPYTLTRTEAPEALRIVADTPGRLALLRRSSASAAGKLSNLELLEVGPATCMTLVVHQNSPWRDYAGLNYRFSRPLRVEAVSPGALQDFQRVLTAFPITGDISLAVRPTHIAIQRLVAGEVDLVVLDVPRRGAVDQPADVMKFVMERELRLLDLPPSLFVESDSLREGEVLVYKGWFWEQPQIYRGLCDAFVLAMPTSGADQLVYTLYSGVAPTATPHQPGFFEKISDAVHRLLVAIGILAS
ncbi:MAG TPA: hypothetical protein DCS21_01760 [Gammaproteobacteria bacterium]|nr:hypothetical protein [Gammaproteobacteria bacterium]